MPMNFPVHKQYFSDSPYTIGLLIKHGQYEINPHMLTHELPVAAPHKN